jgi:hypothetical protein
VLEAESHNVSVVMNQDVRVNRLHASAAIHDIEKGVTVQQVDAGLFRCLPAPKSQAVRFRGAGGRGAPEKVIGHRLQGPALFGGLFLQLAEKLIVNRQGGSSHMQKHIISASIGGDPSLVGRSLKLNDEIYTVIGVMPPGFGFPPNERASMCFAWW